MQTKFYEANYLLPISGSGLQNVSDMQSQLSKNLFLTPAPNLFQRVLIPTYRFHGYAPESHREVDR